jgi:hypothetical protein
VVIEACQEKFLSYEYRDGATSYGAFTFSMVKNLRQKPDTTFEQLITRTAQTLRNLGYKQEPQIIGPASIVRKRIPGAPAPAARKRAAGGRRS